MSPQESMSKIIIDELKTILEYRNLMKETPCPKCAKTIGDIINEEWVHVGEALYQLKINYPEIAQLLLKGEEEIISGNKPRPMIEDMDRPQPMNENIHIS